MSSGKQSKRTKKRKPKKMNGASEFNSQNGNLDYFSTDTNNNTRNFRRDRYFQPNNRNDFGRYNNWQRPVRYHELRGLPKTWNVWSRNPSVQGGPQSQPAPTSYPVRNYWQSFIPRPAANITFTIPNFSGARPPDVFTFGNTSAKPASFAKSAPASGLPRSACLTARKNVRNVVFESSEADISDDVQYLYSVQTNGGQLVEVVDLAEDSEAQNSEKLRAFDHFRSSNNASSDPRGYGNDRMSPKMPEKETSSEKQYAARQKGEKRKNSSEDLQCDICASDYEIVRSRGGEIFKARCEHMFCQECLKKLDLYKCPECDLYLQKLLKIFL